MLLNDFFELTSFQSENNVLKATLLLNKVHPIYEGHFPGRPIVPGVCIVQMLKEILELNFSQKLFLSEAKQIKFLKMIHPEENSVLQAEVNWVLNDDGYRIEASFSVKEEISLKFYGQFTVFL